jgi:hypothetical protein
MGNQANGAIRPTKISGPMAVGFAVVAGALRFLPHHWWNFTPIGALSIYSGARLRLWQAFAISIGVMAVTDSVLWKLQDKPPFDPFVYGSFLVYVLLGRLLIRTESPWRIGAASLLGSLQFFLVTNFGVWFSGLGKLGQMYPGTFQGLMECYLAGIPFYGKDAAPPLGFVGHTIVGDLAFTALLFGTHAVLARWAFPAERVPVTRDEPRL